MRLLPPNVVDRASNRLPSRVARLGGDRPLARPIEAFATVSWNVFYGGGLEPERPSGCGSPSYTDERRLLSEDEAMLAYREIYGGSSGRRDGS